MIPTNLILSRHFIKINACLIGYGLWLTLGQHHIITRTFTIPVCVYNQHQNKAIISPDVVQLTISCTRKLFYFFDAHNTAIHIDATNLHEGINTVILEKQNLFLPDAISLVNLIPSQVQIQLQKIE